MQVNSIKNTPNFGKVKIVPKKNEWNPKIIEAVYDSIAVKKAITENEEKGLDTLIYYSKHESEYSREKRHEFGLVKLGLGTENFCHKVKAFTHKVCEDSVYDFIKTKDYETILPKKLEVFDDFVKSSAQEKKESIESQEKMCTLSNQKKLSEILVRINEIGIDNILDFIKQYKGKKC